MTRGWYLRLLLVLAVAGVGAYLLYPSYYYYYQATDEQRGEFQADNDKFCAAIPKWFACKKFNLGLDLQGGVHLVMGVEVDKALEQRLDRDLDALRAQLTEEKIAFTDVRRERDSQEAKVVLANEADRDKFESMLRKRKVLAIDKRDGNTYSVTLDGELANYVRENALEQAIKTIRNRADKLGVTEPTIARRGSDNILIQLPGVKDPDRAIAIIGKTAQLEFKIVDTDATAVFDEIPASDLPPGVVKRENTFEGPNGRAMREVYFEVPVAQKEATEKLLTPRIAGDREIAFEDMQSQGVGKDAKVTTLRSYLLEARPGITGEYLTDASVEQNQELANDYYVSMKFDQRGAKIFEELTDKNTRRFMAIVLDDKVTKAPIIKQKIPSGNAMIELGRGADAQAQFQEAKDLVLVLKAGALPAPVGVREKREIGKTLGQDTVRRGELAMAVGFAFVVLFMVFYYRLSGLIADFGLFLNFGLTLATMSFFEATLTLPGMAGLVLSVAMAVDANVLICERIREELRLGKTPRAAIEAGYSKAFSAIFDSNVTTLIAAVVLMQYGSGGVRGFAVTLIIGLLASMFTAIVVTRVIYDFMSGRRRLQTLSI